MLCDVIQKDWLDYFALALERTGDDITTVHNSRIPEQLTNRYSLDMLRNFDSEVKYPFSLQIRRRAYGALIETFDFSSCTYIWWRHFLGWEKSANL